MLPHDWLADEGRLVKTDALDHHADDFLPGCRDIAWDLAGAIVEMHLHGGASAALVEHYRRSSGDSSIDRRLAFYVPAYACYRLGYATLAAESLKATADGVRFARLTRRYRRSLEESARRLRPFRQC